MNCTIYRCSKQDQMYLYVREDLPHEDLPAALLQRLGRLEPVMELDLARREQLARVDIAAVRRAMDEPGWFLQMPPDGSIKAQLNDQI